MSQVAPILTPAPMPVAQPVDLGAATNPPRLGQLTPVAPGALSALNPAAPATPSVTITPARPTFQLDGLTRTPALVTSASAYPVQAVLIDYRKPGTAAAGQRFAERLDSLGIESADELVKAGATSWKRKWLSFAGTLFMDKQTKTIIKQELPAWISQADLMRTGVQPDTARLLYYSGIPSALALANTPNMLGPLDLLGRLMSAAMNPANPNTYGRRVPTYDELARAIQVARTLPPVLQW